MDEYIREENWKPCLQKRFMSDFFTICKNMGISDILLIFFIFSLLIGVKSFNQSNGNRQSHKRYAKIGFVK